MNDTQIANGCFQQFLSYITDESKTDAEKAKQCAILHFSHLKTMAITCYNNGRDAKGLDRSYFDEMISELKK